MKANLAYPFLKPPENSIIAKPWLVKRSDAEDRVPISVAFSSWDYEISFSLHRRITLNTTQILNSCGLGVGSLLRLLVSVSTSGGAFRRTFFSCDIGGSSTNIEDIDIDMDSNLLQGDILIKTILVLRKAAGKCQPFSPTLQGSILWNDACTAALEGTLSRFPMTTLDFTKWRSDTGNAPWYLQWNPSGLNINAAANLRLYLNSARQAILEELRDCSETLCNFVIVDVVRQILTTLIMGDEFDGQSESWPENSLGRMAGDWFQAIFPNQTVEVIRERVLTDPGYFEAAIYSYFGGRSAGRAVSTLR